MPRFPAARETLKHDSGDIKLCGHKAYLDIYVLMYTVDNTEGHDIDFGREGLMNNLSFFSHKHLHERF